MKLLRLHGKGGIQLFDADIFTEEEARDDYQELSGYDADKQTHQISFDAITPKELKSFIDTGAIDECL